MPIDNKLIGNLFDAQRALARLNESGFDIPFIVISIFYLMDEAFLLVRLRT